jgi:hypothetical protein
MAEQSLSLQPYSREEGAGLLIDTQTGAVYASQSALARMCGEDESEIRCFHLSGEIEAFSIEVDAAEGLKGLILFDERAIRKAICHYRPGFASALLGMGLRAPSIGSATGEGKAQKSSSVKAKRVTGNVVYLIGDGEHFKIGTSTKSRLSSRFSSIQTGNPQELKVYGVLDGGVGLERKLHRKFSGLRLHGEWFRYSDEVFSEFGIPCRGS